MNVAINWPEPGSECLRTASCMDMGRLDAPTKLMLVMEAAECGKCFGSAA